jgi:hypothetical protein
MPRRMLSNFTYTPLTGKPVQVSIFFTFPIWEVALNDFSVRRCGPFFDTVNES